MELGPAYALELTQEQVELIRLAREFAEREVAPRAAEWDRADAFPAEMVEQMKALGFYGLTIPPEYGGIGVDHVTYALVIEELSRAWISAAGAVNSHTTVAHALVRHGTPEQRAEWLPRLAAGECRAALALTEPHAGSDLQAIRTIARRQPDGGWRLSGSKRFITNGRRAGLLLTLARLEDGSLAAFLVPQPAPGLAAASDWEKLGFRGIETCDLVLDEVPLAAGALLGGEPGRGWAQVLDALDAGRIAIAASAVGLARAALEDAVAYAREREAFGKPLTRLPAVQQQVADLATKLNAARLLTLAAAREKDRRGEAATGSSMAKVMASEVAQEAALTCLRLHGGYGYTLDYRAERYYRDAPAYLVGEGANEVLRALIGRRLGG